MCWATSTDVWRIMLAVAALPAIALFFGMLRMPESPRWLLSKGRNEDAVRVLSTIRSPERAEAEARDIRATVALEERTTTAGLGEVLRNKWLVRIVVIGIGVAVFQQLTGINSILYYGQVVLAESGFGAQAALIANIAPGIIGVVGAFVALWMMERVNRRTTFITGYALTAICHFLIGFASVSVPTDSAAGPYILLILIVAFVGSMQTFLNVATWVLLSEIFPLRIRALGMGISVFCLWVTNALLSLYFPTIIGTFGITGSFFGFAAVNALALVAMIRFLPETRGRTLEAVEEGVTTGAIFTIRSRSRHR